MYDLGDAFHIDLENAKSNSESVIKGNNFRITILTERLVRIEYSLNGMFLDLPTELVSFRKFDKPEFEIKSDSKYLEISTKYFKLYYTKESKLTASSLRIVPMVEKADNAWYYGYPSVKTYDGILSSLDEDNTYKKGIYSVEGFSSIDDSKSLTISENGNFEKRKNEEIDIYVFVYNNDFNLAIKDYIKLTGAPNLIPRYALGNWWSKNCAYKEEDAYYLINKFRKEEIPLSVLLLDNKWHSHSKEHITGYTFDKENIKEPSKFINEIHNLGVRIGLNINPIEGILKEEEQFENVSKYITPNEKGNITFAPLDTKYIDVLLKMMLHPLENIGVDFFWIDYSNKDTYGHYMLTHYLNIDSGRNENKRNIVLSKSTNVPHKESIMYSGRTNVSFDTLRKIPHINTSASNIGASWWSHDIGGFKDGVEDSELYIRNVELGCFSPIFRISSDESRYYKREPWRWDAKTYNIAKDYMRLRNKLIPYLYSMAYKYTDEYIPIVDPIYHKEKELYYDSYYKNEYMFGTELLVSPITNPKDELMNRVIHKVYLPEGIWYDFKSGKRFPGGRSYVTFYKDEDYPVFARAGAIIPLNRSVDNTCSHPTTLEIDVFPKQSNTFILYEDDGVSNLYKQGYFLKTLIDYNYQENNYTLIIRAKEGKSGIIPETRNYRIRFKNTLKTDEVVANFDGNNVETNCYTDDNDFIVELNNIPTIGQLSINCKGKALENDPIRLINEDIDEIISDLEIETKLKDIIANILFSNLPIKNKRIEIRKLKKKKLDPKFIKMFLRLLEYVEQI